MRAPLPTLADRERDLRSRASPQPTELESSALSTPDRKPRGSILQAGGPPLRPAVRPRTRSELSRRSAQHASGGQKSRLAGARTGGTSRKPPANQKVSERPRKPLAGVTSACPCMVVAGSSFSAGLPRVLGEAGARTRPLTRDGAPTSAAAVGPHEPRPLRSSDHSSEFVVPALRSLTAGSRQPFHNVSTRLGWARKLRETGGPP
jgi:hypothetical protein